MNIFLLRKIKLMNKKTIKKSLQLKIKYDKIICNLINYCKKFIHISKLFLFLYRLATHVEVLLKEKKTC